MGKPTGFMEYLREVAEEVAPSDRIRNWDEFHLPMPDPRLQTQGARCMDCGTPLLPHRHDRQRHGQRLPHQTT